MPSTIQCVRIRPDEPFEAPKAQREGDAGLDLAVSRYVCVSPGQYAHLSTNIALALPIHHFGLIMPRSSTLWRKGLHVSPGVIDSEYRGEVMILVYNMTDRHVVVDVGERIAQMLVLPLLTSKVIVVDGLSRGTRGDAGFGSTGGYKD